MEVAIGKFPYKEWRNVFAQIKQVVEGAAPQLPTGKFSEEFEDFISSWSVCALLLSTVRSGTDLISLLVLFVLFLCLLGLGQRICEELM